MADGDTVVASIKAEDVSDIEDEVQDNPLRIVDVEMGDVATMDVDPIVPVDNEDQVRLDRLPRPVNELNCRQARTYLVKLLRAANGGQNPNYGNPDMRPPFWPDYYWPWTQLTDVHTKPRGMNEPLQYSEMMKIAIGRGYQYFGYDPKTYIYGEAGAVYDEDDNLVVPAEPLVNIQEDSFIVTDEFDGSKYFLKPPPRLPRPLSKVNCVQARTALAKLLRYQQAGNNPVYGSPDTEPPWWPNHLIRWVDMVDLRGKPPYLPDSKSYTDVLKEAIENAYKYYGYSAERCIEDEPIEHGQLTPGKQANFPLIPAAGIAPAPPPKPTTPMQPFLPRPAPLPIVPPKIQQILSTDMAAEINIAAAPPPPPEVQADNDDPMADDTYGDDDEDGDLPPRLPIPVGKMNCSLTRTCLAKLIRFYCGRGQLPNYGNPDSMPVWWPNHLIDWTRIKNLSHRYEGYLGNTYSNCLRIAMIKGYAHYGLDANEYVEAKGIRPPSNSVASAFFNGSPDGEEGSGAADISLAGLPVTQAVTSSLPASRKRPLPMLVPLDSLVSEGEYPQSLLDTRDWFPPRLAWKKAVDASPADVRQLKTCKVRVDRSAVDKANRLGHGPVSEAGRLDEMFAFFRADLCRQKFTDFSLVASRRTPNRPKEKLTIRVHKFVLAAHSNKLRRLLQGLGEDDSCLVLSGVNGTILKIIVDALYTGHVVLDGKTQLKQFESVLRSLHTFGILLNLRPGVYNGEHDHGDEDEAAVVNGEDIAMHADTAKCARPENEELAVVNDPSPKRAKMPIKDVINVSLDDEATPLNTRPKRKSQRSSPEEAKFDGEVKREEKNASPEVDEDTPPKRKRSKRVSLESPKKKVAAALVTEPAEANKPNFDAVTLELMNEKVGEGQLAFVKWLQDERFLRKTPPQCLTKECNETLLVLKKDPKCVDGVSWKCSKCPESRSIRDGSIFGRKCANNMKVSLSWIIQIILCWSDNTSLHQCQQMTGADVDSIFLWYDECRDYYGTV